MRFFILMLISMAYVLLANISYADLNRSKSGIVTDSATGLEWQDNILDVRITGFENAIAYCESLTLNGRGWRLPNANELMTIVNFEKYNPAIYGQFKMINFSPSAQFILDVDYYWSSTTFAGSTNQVFLVLFRDGNLSPNKTKQNIASVRCVRKG